MRSLRQDGGLFLGGEGGDNVWRRGWLGVPIAASRCTIFGLEANHGDVSPIAQSMQSWTCGLARHGGLWVCASEAGETARVFLVSKVCIRSLPWRPLSTQHALVLARHVNPPPTLRYLFTNLFPGPISSHRFAFHHHLIYTSYIVRLGKIHGQNVCFKFSSLSTIELFISFFTFCCYLIHTCICKFHASMQKDGLE